MPSKQAPKLDIVPEVSAATKALAPALKRLTRVLSNLDPSTLPIGALSDTLYDLRQLGKQLGSVTAAFDDILAPALKNLEEHFIQTLAVGESSGVQGMHSRTQITDDVIPVAEDWPRLYAYIARTKSFELLNKAINRNAVRERWDLKKEIPGVGKFRAKCVSCTKLSGKGGK